MLRLLVMKLVRNHEELLEKKCSTAYAPETIVWDIRTVDG